MAHQVTGGPDFRVVAISDTDLEELEKLKNDYEDFMRRAASARDQRERMLARLSGAAANEEFRLDASGRYLLVRGRTINP